MFTNTILVSRHKDQLFSVLGGMLIHHMYSRGATGMFAAYIPQYGLPLQGFAVVPSTAASSSIMHLHGRNDHIIPSGGGLADGWYSNCVWRHCNRAFVLRYYESITSVYRKWAVEKQCDTITTSVTTPYDGLKNRQLACTEYVGCSSGRVLVCLYNGAHGATFVDMEEMSWWFFSTIANDTRNIQ